ncbi:replication protein A 70 kDa DNA-binding subunit [Diorhabda sublineata]|uniref:replication protein A 70 kDa DNA-binding subunit n=1 Tax=Diorhabda sublineata TaxID=1163346 RepID=UPI0024E067B9|nr:replication protein A 70 kDa DNA-binding subunit [Diorhabda sublineata]
MPSPAQYNMSEGCLKTIMSGGEYPKPIMQILGSKRINAGSGDKERIRILLSDGKYTISFAMLTAQMNEKIGPNGVENFSVVQIDKYITSVVSNAGKGDARVLLILEMTVIEPGSTVGQKIGSPIPFSDADTKGTATTNGTSSTSTFKPTNIKNGSAMETTTSDTNLSSSMIHPISCLTPYQNKWVIKARVTNKSAIRTWSNSRGEGKLFSFDLIDETGEIRVTAFRDLVDKFYDYLQVDKVYYITKCQLKPANKQFSTLKNEYEMTLTADSSIQECFDSNDAIPTTQYEFVSIDKISEKETNTLVDVIGVVKNVGELQTFQARSTGKELKKKEVVLVDQSQTAINFTLWGTDAENFDGTNNPVVVIKGARVSEFGGGKNLSMLSSSTLKINPEMKECYRMRGWYDSEGQNVQIKNLSARSGSGNFSTNWMTFKEVKDQKLGSSDKGDYYQAKATILLVKAENIIYKACPTAECNKKIIDLENSMYRCEKCNREFPNFKYRLLASMNVGDHTGNQWVSMFSSEVEKILGMTAEEVGQALEHNKEEVANIVDRAHFKEYLLKCRAKIETYNDEARLKTVCIKVDPVNYEEYNSFLIEKIQQLIA